MNRCFKYCWLLSMAILWSSCVSTSASDKSQEAANTGVALVTEYPKEINSVELQKLYDETKWRLYCIHCDEKILFADRNLKYDITIGECKLEFDKTKKYSDSVEIDFFFYYNNIRLDGSSLLMSLPTYGAVFKLPDSLVKYSSRDNVRYFTHQCLDKDNCIDRYVVPLQPEVIKYIQENKDKLDLWFRKEAIKRGVINE